jgi:hypothetical protein
MAYNVDTFSGNRTVVIEDGTIDSTFDLKLIGKNYAGYGEIQNENFLHLLENFANDTAPPRPLNGQIWYDDSAKRIKYYDSTSQRWRGTGGIESGPVPPINPAEGDLWWKTDLKQLLAWDGVTWVVVGPQNLGGFATTRMESKILTDLQDLTHPVIIAYVNGEPMFIISKDEEFTLSSASVLELGGISKYGVIKSGITLINSNNEDGITSNSRLLWGTSSHALYADAAELAEIANLSLRSNNITGGQTGSIPFQSSSDATSLLQPNTTTPRRILADTGTGTVGNSPEWIILPTILPIARADGTILNIPLANGSFTVGKRDGTMVNIIVN